MGLGHTSNLHSSAQVRDTSIADKNLTGIHGRHHDSHLGRDVAAGAAGGAIGGVPGAALGAGASHLSHQHGTQSSSLTGTGMGATSTTGTAYNRGATTGTGLTDDAMTRSEEHLLVGKEKINAGSVGLHKYVTTEKVGTEVPVMREKAVLEREPITDANRDAALRGPDFKEAHHEVNLMAEKVVTQKEAVPIERVRLRKEAEITNQHVEADLRKEHIELAEGGKTYGAGMGLGTEAGLAGKQLGSAPLGQQQSMTGSRLGSDIAAGDRALNSSDRRL